MLDFRSPDLTQYPMFQMFFKNRSKSHQTYLPQSSVCFAGPQLETSLVIRGQESDRGGVGLLHLCAHSDALLRFLLALHLIPDA